MKLDPDRSREYFDFEKDVDASGLLEKFNGLYEFCEKNGINFSFGMQFSQNGRQAGKSCLKMANQETPDVVTAVVGLCLEAKIPALLQLVDGYLNGDKVFAEEKPNFQLSDEAVSFIKNAIKAFRDFCEHRGLPLIACVATSLKDGQYTRYIECSNVRPERACDSFIAAAQALEGMDHFVSFMQEDMKEPLEDFRKMSPLQKKITMVLFDAALDGDEAE